MGTVLIFLALFVVFGHLPGLAGELNPVGHWMRAEVAVQGFFIISGFYMTLILKGKYQSRGIRAFYTARILKLFPIYYVVLILSIILYIAIEHFGLTLFEFRYEPKWKTYDYPIIIFNAWNSMSDRLETTGILFLLLSHTTLLGQEFASYIATSGSGLMSMGEFVKTDGFRDAAVLAYGPDGSVVGEEFQPFKDSTHVTMNYFLFIPQAWSLGLELLFYLIAPAIVYLGRRAVLLLALCALGVRIYFLEYTGLGELNFFEYKFFPFELVFFLLGVISYYLYEFIQRTDLKTHGYLQRGALIFLLLSTLLVAQLPSMNNWIFYGTLAVLMPFAFRFDDPRHDDVSTTWRAKFARLDRWLGDLSYPLYISHVMVISVAYGLAYELVYSAGHVPAQLAIIVVAILAAMLLNQFIQQPVERFKAKRSKVPTRAERRRRR